MPDESRHESADLEDYSVQEPADSLTGEPGEAGDDPLDRGVIPPERWSAGIKFGSTADEQTSGESLDQLLAEEEPDTPFDVDDDLPEDDEDDEEADEYLDGLLLDDGPDPRAGRLVAEDEGAHPDERGRSRRQRRRHRRRGRQRRGGGGPRGRRRRHRHQVRRLKAGQGRRSTRLAPPRSTARAAAG